MTKALLVLSGGAIGSLLRYSVSGLAHKYYGAVFPYGTLAVNLIGSFLIGLLWGLFESFNISSNVRSFLFIGILGGFTTFSSYSLETLNLLRDGELKLAFANILANNILGLLLVFLGFIAAKGVNNIV
jgi:CrcB protein